MKKGQGKRTEKKNYSGQMPLPGKYYSVSLALEGSHFHSMTVMQYLCLPSLQVNL